MIRCSWHTDPGEQCVNSSVSYYKFNFDHRVFGSGVVPLCADCEEWFIGIWRHDKPARLSEGEVAVYEVMNS